MRNINIIYCISEHNYAYVSSDRDNSGWSKIYPPEIALQHDYMVLTAMTVPNHMLFMEEEVLALAVWIYRRTERPKPSGSK